MRETIRETVDHDGALALACLDRESAQRVRELVAFEPMSQVKIGMFYGGLTVPTLRELHALRKRQR